MLGTRALTWASGGSPCRPHGPSLVPVEAARRSPTGLLAFEVMKPERREKGVQFAGFWRGFLGPQRAVVDDVEFCRARGSARRLNEAAEADVEAERVRQMPEWYLPFMSSRCACAGHVRRRPPAPGHQARRLLLETAARRAVVRTHQSTSGITNREAPRYAPCGKWRRRGMPRRTAPA